MPTCMKAAYLTKPGELRITDRPIPEPGPGEALVRMKATAVCGTDVSIYNGQPLLDHPVIQGHEGTGIVAALGDGVAGLSEGERVIINPAYFCGTCFYCKNGRENLCHSGGLLGRDRDGCFAEYVTLPAACLIHLPEEISFEDGTSLQTLATVLRAWERLDELGISVKNSTVAVIGLGAPGLLHTRMAVLGGAKVFASTRSRWKLDIAQSYGGIPVSPAEADLGEVLKGATDGRGVDLVIECVGSEKTFRQALDIVRPGGTIIPFGIQHNIRDFDAYTIYYKELVMVGTRAMNNRGYEHAIRLAEAHLIDLSPLITNYFTLDETETYFRKAHSAAGDSLRMVCRI